MTCPDCQSEMRVWRTSDGGSARVPTKLREHRCECGQKFVTEERITRRLTAISGNRGPVKDPLTDGKPTVKGSQTDGLGSFPVQKGGRGVSVSDPTPSSFLSLIPVLSASDPDQSLDHSQGVDRARAKRRKGAPVYSPDFLKFWEFYPRKVGKGAAWKAWEVQQPEINRVIGTLGWQKNSSEWRKDSGAFIPHPATYLNARRWEDEPTGRNVVPTRTPGPPVAIAELAAERARKAEESEAKQRQEAAERFRQQAEQDKQAKGAT